MPIEKTIALEIKEAEKRKKKVAMFHFQSLIYADELKAVNPVQFCRTVGMRDSFATEFRKMLSLSKMIKDEGYLLKKA